jgi:hypothetical protein
MKRKECQSRLTKTASHCMLTALVGVGLLLCQMPSLCAQTTSPGTGQEKQSKPGELQHNPKPQRLSRGPRMDPARPLAAMPVSGKIEKMEEQLAHPLEVGPGNKQPNVDLAQAANPPQGGGEQQKRPSPGASPAKSHLHLVLRITESGPAEVVSATEVPGEAVLSDAPTSSFVYEVTSNGRTLAAQALPDPFEIRSFPPLDTPQQGHHIERAKTATIIVKVPQTSLASATLDKMTVRLYKVKPGAPIEKVNPAVLKKLRQENRLETRLVIPASTLGPAIRQKGLQLAPQ